MVICGAPGGEKERDEQNTRQQFAYQGNRQKCQQITSFIQNWGEFTLVKDEKQKTNKELATDIYHKGYTEKKTTHANTLNSYVHERQKEKRETAAPAFKMCKPVGGIYTEVPLSYFASFSELLVFCGHWVPRKDKDTSITASRKMSNVKNNTIKVKNTFRTSYVTGTSTHNCPGCQEFDISPVRSGTNTVTVEIQHSLSTGKQHSVWKIK